MWVVVTRLLPLCWSVIASFDGQVGITGKYGTRYGASLRSGDSLVGLANKKLLGAPGLATRSKDATGGSSPYY